MEDENLFDIISNLPAEIRHIIFTKLEAKDLLSANSVCRKWNEFTNEECLWKAICVREGIEDVDLGNKQPIRVKAYFENFSIHWKAVYMRQREIFRNWRHNAARCRNFKPEKDKTIICINNIYYVDETVLISLCRPGSYEICICSIIDQKVLHILPIDAVIQIFQIFKDKLAIVTIKSYTLNIWNFKSGEKLHSIQLHNPPNCIRLSDKFIVVGCLNGIIYLYDADSGCELDPLLGHTNEIICLDYDGLMLLSGSADNSVRVWNMDGVCKFILKATEQSYYVQFVEDCIVSCANDTKIRIWNKSDGTFRHMFHDNLYPIVHLKGGRIMSYADRSENPFKHRILVWDIKTGNCLVEIDELHSVSHHSVVDQILVIASSNGFLEFWDLVTGLMIRRFTLFSVGKKGELHSMKVNKTDVFLNFLLYTVPGEYYSAMTFNFDV